MVEYRPGLIPPEAERAEVVVLGGSGTTEAFRWLYDPILGDDSSLSPSERFIPNPSEEIGDIQEMRKRREGAVENIVSRLGQRVVVFGHSIGGLQGTDLGRRRPDIVAAVANAGGLQDGMEKETLSTWLTKMAVGNPPDAVHMRHDSPFMKEHRERIATEWSPDVLLASMAATIDTFFPRLRGLGLELPDGQEHQRLIVAPKYIPSVLLRRFTGVPDGGMPENVQRLPSRFMTEHLFLPMAGVIAEYIDDFRVAAAQKGLKVGSAVNALTPEPEPAYELQAVA